MLSGTGHSSFGDGYMLLLTARSLLDEGRLDIAPVTLAGSAQRIGQGERTYAIFAPGLAFAHLPALVVGRVLPIVQPTVGGEPADGRRRDEFWAQITNAWIMATVVTLILLCGAELGYGLGASAVLAAAMALASPLWLYARIDSTEALQALGVVGAFYALLRWRTSHALHGLVAAGVFLSVAVAAKMANLALIPLFVVYSWMASPVGAARLRTAVALLAPLLAVVVLLGLYNHARFGSFLDPGYHPRWSGSVLAGATTLLASPSYGLLCFWPASVLGLLGVPEFLRRHRGEGILIVGVFVTLLALYTPWRANWGMSWGPRFLIPAVPLLSFFLLPVFDGASPWHRRVIVPLLVAGLAVQLVAVLSSYWQQVYAVRWNLARTDARRLYGDPEIAPPRIGLWWLRATYLEHFAEAPRAEGFLANPPWAKNYPWKDLDRAVAELRELRGLDLWAAPDGWRMPYRPVWRHADPEPPAANPQLALVLLLVAMVAIAGVISSARLVFLPTVGGR